MIPEFVYIETEKNGTPLQYVLHTLPPFYLGQVVRFSTLHSLQQWADDKARKEGHSIAGKPYEYNILIIYAGNLGQAVPLPITQAEADALARIFRRMADFYLHHKILPHASKYRKYKE